MESISKSRIQGVWDPSNSTRTGIIAHSTRVVIPSGYRHFIWLPPLHPAAATFHPDVSHPESGCRCHSTRMSTSGIRLPPPFHPDVHIQNSATAAIPPGCPHPEFSCRRHYTRMFCIRNSDARWERRAFQLPRSHVSRSAYSAYPESFAAILHSAAMSPEASRYVRPTF